MLKNLGELYVQYQSFLDTMAFALPSNEAERSLIQGKSANSTIAVGGAGSTMLLPSPQQHAQPTEHNGSSIVALAAAHVQKDHQRGAKDDEETSSYYLSTSTDETSLLERNLARGANFVRTTSGCAIASWAMAVTGIKNGRFADCQSHRHKEITENFQNIQADDTVYVPIVTMERFVQQILPNISVPIVLISGQEQAMPRDAIPVELQLAIVENPNVIKWFTHNTVFYANAVLNNSKVESFPYGFKKGGFNPSKSAECMRKYGQEFMASLYQPKTKGIFIGWVNRNNNREARGQIPVGRKLSPEAFYHEIAKSRFVFSPDGDRPDCYRHYESIGLGAIPVTQLHMKHYGHFQEGQVIFNNTKWQNVTEADLLRLLGREDFPRVNRNLVFEEHWIDHVDKVIGRPLRWWDQHAEKHAQLSHFVLNYSNPFVQGFRNATAAAMRLANATSPGALVL